MERLLVLLQHGVEVNDVVLAAGDDAHARLAALVGGVDGLVVGEGVAHPAILPLLVPLPDALLAGELLVDLLLAARGQRRLLDQIDEYEERREPHGRVRVGARRPLADATQAVADQLQHAHELVEQLRGVHDLGARQLHLLEEQAEEEQTRGQLLLDERRRLAKSSALLGKLFNNNSPLNDLTISIFKT